MEGEIWLDASEGVIDNTDICCVCMPWPGGSVIIAGGEPMMDKGEETKARGRQG